jgi:hypothetical protein
LTVSDHERAEFFLQFINPLPRLFFDDHPQKPTQRAHITSKRQILQFRSFGDELGQPVVLVFSFPEEFHVCPRSNDVPFSPYGVRGDYEKTGNDKKAAPLRCGLFNQIG